MHIHFAGCRGAIQVNAMPSDLEATSMEVMLAGVYGKALKARTP